MKTIDDAPARLPDTNQDAHSWQALLRAQEYCRLERNATVTVDAYGRITDYSLAGAQLLGCPVENLMGKPLSQFLEQLPFGQNTPGYNLAYAVFHGAGGRWQRHTAATPDGQVVGVDVALSSVMMDGNRAIKLTLKAANSGEQAHCH